MPHQGSSLQKAVLMGHEFFSISVLVTENPTHWKGFLQEMVARGLREPLLRDRSWSARSKRSSLKA